MKSEKKSFKKRVTGVRTLCDGYHPQRVLLLPYWERVQSPGTRLVTAMLDSYKTKVIPHVWLLPHIVFYQLIHVFLA